MGATRNFDRNGSITEGIWGCNVARPLAAAAQIPCQLCRTTKVGADPAALQLIAQATACNGLTM